MTTTNQPGYGDSYASINDRRERKIGPMSVYPVLDEPAIPVVALSVE